MPTPSVENYLKAVYHLETREDERVKTKQIAQKLDISLPSVTSMLKSLGEEGLVDYRPYHGARLTDSGTKAALRVIRNHRLIEVFLVQTLGYSWDEVHDEAERLEHAVSEELVSRIDDFLGQPKFDPHGDPIPTAEGEVHRPEAMPLSDATPGSRYRVERVLDQEPEVLRYLDKIGLTLATIFEVREVLSFDGQMFLELDGADAAISRSLASRLLVAEV
jgi:DtxR family transcriptional regulator, Mn-dependent transcriptional regulator